MQPLLDPGQGSRARNMMSARLPCDKAVTGVGGNMPGTFEVAAPAEVA